MNVMTRQRRTFHCMRIGGVLILVIAVWGTLGLQAQSLSEASSISGTATAIAAPAAAIGAVAAAVAEAPATVVPKTNGGTTPGATTTPGVAPMADAGPTTAAGSNRAAAPSAAATAAPKATEAAPAASAAAAGAAAGAPIEATSSVELTVGQSTVLDVGSPITRVSLTSADIADALVTSSKQLLVNGKTPGAISMYVWDRQGTLRRYDVIVQRDISRLSDQLTRLFPSEAITAHSSGKNVVISGNVTSKEVADRIVNVAAGYTDKKEEVVSLLQVATPPSDQVLLHVRFAEVSRSALTEVGASLFTSATGIHNTIGRATTQQFPSASFDDMSWTKQSGDFGSDVTSAQGKLTFSDFLNLFVLSEKYDLGILIRALQSRGLFQSLAEPNLVAQSGKEASFLAGGEFPIPVAQGSGANIGVSVTFKEFGVRLGFTPVINGDRIQLKVRPEVSTLDFANAVQLGGFRIPALTTRRTETEIELRDRQTFAIAGLLNNSMTSTMQKIPGIGDIPVLGLLFRSKAAQKNRTELVVMITPEILRTGSVGVTNQLPRQQEPFLPGLPQNRSIAPPPPAFPTGGQTGPVQ
jgi:pilus assembly protein CpaC